MKEKGNVVEQISKEEKKRDGRNEIRSTPILPKKKMHKIQKCSFGSKGQMKERKWYLFQTK